MKQLKSVKDLDVKGKRVLVRVDFNVPMEKGRCHGRHPRARLTPHPHPFDSKRSAGDPDLPFGPPQGAPNPKYSLAPVAQHLSQILKKPVAFAPDCVGPLAETAVKNLRDGDVLLLENLRFHGEEEKNDPAFSKSWRGWPTSLFKTLSAPFTGPTPAPPACRNCFPARQGFCCLRNWNFWAVSKITPPNLSSPLWAGQRCPTRSKCWKSCWTRWTPWSSGAPWPTPFYSPLALRRESPWWKRTKWKPLKTLLKWRRPRA
jgi:hypothetical protein